MFHRHSNNTETHSVTEKTIAISAGTSICALCLMWLAAGTADPRGGPSADPQRPMGPSAGFQQRVSGPLIWAEWQMSGLKPIDWFLCRFCTGLAPERQWFCSSWQIQPCLKCKTDFICIISFSFHCFLLYLLIYYHPSPFFLLFCFLTPLLLLLQQAAARQSASLFK